MTTQVNPVIFTDIDRKRQKITFAEGVIGFVKLTKFDSPKTFNYQGKSIISTHSLSVALKEKGKEGKDDFVQWIGFGDIEIKGDSDEVRVKDGDDKWHTLARGMEVVIDISKVDDKGDGRVYYNAKKSGITVISTEGVAEKIPEKGKGQDSASSPKSSYKKDTSGMEVGHAVNGGFELIRSGASLSPVEAAKIVHDATVALKEEEAKNRGVDASNYDLGASVGHAILNACKNSKGNEVNVESLIEEAKSVLEISSEITTYVKGGNKVETKEEKPKKPVKEKVEEKLPEAPMDFDSDIPF